MKKLDELRIEDLRLILAIVEARSLTAGAARMRMSQSNASYALKKIQGVFQLDLFVREGRNLIPSEFGWQVYNHTKTMLVEFEEATRPPVFCPRREFTLRFGATEYEAFAIFPKILDMLKKHAPLVKVQIVAIDTADISGQLDGLDFVFVPVDIKSNNIETLKVLDDGYVTIFDSTVQSAPIELNDFVKAKHAIASFDGGIVTEIDHLLAKRGLKREVSLSVFGFTALAELMRNSKLITTLPKHVATKVFGGFSTCKCPLDLELMSLYLCWKTNKKERGEIRWFVELMSKIY